MIKKITYEDKVSIQNDESVAVVHKVTDTDMNEVKEVVNNNADELISLQADNTTNKTDISNIKAEQTSQNAELEELRAENERLRADINALPTGQAEGETIDLTDSAEMRFSSFEIRGNSRQESRSGKNKVKLNNIQETTKDGLKYSCRNGKLYLNGTLTKAVLIDFEATDIQAGSYYFSSYVEGNYSGSWARYLRTVNSEKAITNSGTIEITENEKVYFRFYANAGCVFNNVIVTAQLEEGSSATEWEQYGAMPSLDYPSEVESCGDNVNLIDCVSVHGYANASGQIDLNASTNYLSVPNMLEANPNTTYTIDFVGYKDGYLLVSEYDESKAFIKRTQYSTRTFTTSSNCRYVFIHLYNSVADAFSTIGTKIKMVEGTSTGAYSPYGQGCINEVVCNKNLFDEEIESGNINSSGVNYDDSTMIRSKNYIKVNPNENIIISNNGIALQVNIVEYDKDYTFISRKYVNATYLTTSNDTKYIKFVTSTITNPKIQLEEGSIATEFEEHKSQTYKIPNQQPIRSIEIAKNTFLRDTFIKKNNKWYERHYIARKIFDGNENLVYTANTGNRYAYNIALNGKIKGQHSKEYLSNMYKQKSEGSWSSDGIISVSETSYNTYIFITGLSTTSDVKAWLKELYDAGTPLYIDYILETPLDIECTEEQSTILFDIEQNAKTYDKVTHMYSTDNVSSYKDVTYKKDLDTMINNLNTAIVALGGV